MGLHQAHFHQCAHWLHQVQQLSTPSLPPLSTGMHPTHSSHWLNCSPISQGVPYKDEDSPDVVCMPIHSNI